MSGSDGEIGAGGSLFIDNHDCDSPAARVSVGGTTIPVINDGIRTEIRTDGVMGLTHFSEVYFPAKWNDTRYDLAVNALDPDENSVYDSVDIEIKDYVSGEYEVVHRGFVMGAGGGSHGDIEMRMTVGDAGQLLGGIPFDQSYDTDATMIDVIRDVHTAMQEAVEGAVFETVSLNIGSLFALSNDEESGPDDVVDVVGRQLGERLNAFTDWLFQSTKDFHGHVDSAADALKWVEDHVDGKFYFEPLDGDSGISLTYDEDYDGTTLSGHFELEGNRRLEEAARASMSDVYVYRNNALHETRPVNMAIVRGSRNGNGAAPIATAVHTKLLNRAAVPQIVSEEDDSIDTIIGAEERAKNLLEDQLNKTSLGRILTAPAPAATPHSSIISQPACGNVVDRSTAPFTYDVSSVVHRIAAQDQRDERRHQTELKVTPEVTQSSITINNSELYVIDEELQSDWERGKEAGLDDADLTFPSP